MTWQKGPHLKNQTHLKFNIDKRYLGQGGEMISCVSQKENPLTGGSVRENPLFLAAYIGNSVCLTKLRGGRREESWLKYYRFMLSYQIFMNKCFFICYFPLEPFSESLKWLIFKKFIPVSLGSRSAELLTLMPDQPDISGLLGDRQAVWRCWRIQSMCRRVQKRKRQTWSLFF